MAAVLKTTEVRSRIDEGLKERATEVLGACGLTVSSAIRLMLERVVAEDGLPFAVKRPSPKTARAIRQAAQIQASFDSLDQMFEALDGEGQGKARKVAKPKAASKSAGSRVGGGKVARAGSATGSAKSAAKAKVSRAKESEAA